MSLCRSQNLSCEPLLHCASIIIMPIQFAHADHCPIYTADGGRRSRALSPQNWIHWGEYATQKGGCCSFPSKLTGQVDAALPPRNPIVPSCSASSAHTIHRVEYPLCGNNFCGQEEHYRQLPPIQRKRMSKIPIILFDYKWNTYLRKKFFFWPTTNHLKIASALSWSIT